VVFFHRNLMQNESLRRENDILKISLIRPMRFFWRTHGFPSFSVLKKKFFYGFSLPVIATSADNWSSG